MKIDAMPERSSEVLFSIAYRMRGGWDIFRANVAHYMPRVLGKPETIKQVIGIAN